MIFEYFKKQIVKDDIKQLAKDDINFIEVNIEDEIMISGTYYPTTRHYVYNDDEQYCDIDNDVYDKLRAEAKPWAHRCCRIDSDDNISFIS